MASTVFPAASAASKTMFRVTLTSGTSYTVPTGALYLNVKTFGGGQGGNASGNGLNGLDGNTGQVIASTLSSTPGNSIAYAIGAGGTTSPVGSGGNTTFTGATTATGGSAAGPTGEGADNGGRGAQSGVTGPSNGGSGKIEIEYWA